MNKKLTVLMVDDEAQFRETTKKLLSKRGFNIILAENGEEAISKLGEKPDVVILDIRMPGMDGHQALQEIKKRQPKLPVIMLTGHGAMPSAKKSLEGGAFDYLSKPCDIDLLATKINDAYRHDKLASEEKQVKEVMIPIEDYTTVREYETVKDGVLKLKESFTSKVSTSKLMETGHRSILVLDKQGNAVGILAIFDLLNAIMPSYLSAPKPSMADSVQYSPMFWSGMFGREINKLMSKKVSDVMSPAPITIEGDTNLMEASYMMVTQKVRRIVVVENKEVIGIIREQDLFFEMERICSET